MAETPRKLYWDTSMFLCFLNRAEAERRKIAQDILDNAKKGKVVIITSWFTVAEVIRPKFVPKGQKLDARSDRKNRGDVSMEVVEEDSSP